MKTTGMSRGTAVIVVAALAASIAPADAAKRGGSPSADVARGRYLVRIGGCNDCHTPGFDAQGGKVDEKRWLIGSGLGWRGAWGTTYPANVRLYVQSISEDGWIARWRAAGARPPMPWTSLRSMSDDDLRAIYRYVKWLGPTGSPAPAYLPPDREPGQPFVQFPSPPATKAVARRTAR